MSKTRRDKARYLSKTRKRSGSKATAIAKHAERREARKQ